MDILRGLRDRYEAHHRVNFTDEALFQAVELSTRYVTGRCLPDKAIDVIDESGARVRLKNMTPPPDLAKLEEKIEKIQKEKILKGERNEKDSSLIEESVDEVARIIIKRCKRFYFSDKGDYPFLDDVWTNFIKD